jgi:hypothetical protein
MAQDIGITMGTFSTVDTLDQAIWNATAFYSSSTCTGYTSSQRIRYQDSVLCTILVQDKSSVQCADGAPNLCQYSCSLYATQLKTMIEKACPSDKTSLEKLGTLSGDVCTEAKSWSGLVDSGSSCVNATTNEAATCGKSISNFSPPSAPPSPLPLARSLP